MTNLDLDALARSVHDLINETASHQVSREIAHLAEIAVDVDASGVTAPAGYRAPASGVVTTHVVATSRDIPAAGVEMRVSVWVAAPETEGPALLITRADTDRSLGLDVDDVSPIPTPHAKGLVNDFVAVIIAHMVSSLNVAMQRTYIRESDDQVAEFDS